MAKSSSHNPSSPEITPKKEPVTLDKPKSTNPFLPADQVEFIFEEIAFTTNNEVALLYPSHPNSEYFREALKPNQTEGPPFTDHMKAICNFDVPVDSKAPKPSSQTEETKASKSKTGQSKKETQSRLAKDKIPSHPSPPTPVVSEMHKEAQQVVGGPTSLGATSEEGAYPQLSSVDFTAEFNPGLSAPNDSIPSQQGIDEGLKDIKLITYLLLMSVAELKNIQWELPAEFQALPVLVSLVQKQLKTLDSLPSLLNKVLRRLRSIFTSVYAAVQKLKKASGTFDIPFGKLVDCSCKAAKVRNDPEGLHPSTVKRSIMTIPFFLTNKPCTTILALFCGLRHANLSCSLNTHLSQCLFFHEGIEQESILCFYKTDLVLIASHQPILGALVPQNLVLGSDTERKSATDIH
ncbi:hypothetical protein Tco_1514681 [Tanacetum coccineum]